MDFRNFEIEIAPVVKIGLIVLSIMFLLPWVLLLVIVFGWWQP